MTKDLSTFDSYKMETCREEEEEEEDDNMEVLTL
jgi:hypothetical protein